jgi:glucose/arabinose dehydrogenase
MLAAAAATSPIPAAADAPPELAAELLVGGLHNPTIISHANDGSNRLFIGEQRGVIWIWDGSQLLATPFLDILDRLTFGGEQGLLGLAFAPDFAATGYFYAYYSAPDTTGDPDIDHFTVVSRFSVSTGDPDQADPASEQVLLRYPQPFGNHNAGMLAFGPDGLLYVGMGDGGSAGDPGDRAQNLDLLLGKILRIDPQGDAFPADPDRNYTVPATNPFVGVPGADEIWAYGLRNPWRFSFDRATGDLFIGDVGQNAWEEIDYQPAASAGGENYGWRCYEGTHAFNLAGCGPPGDYVAPILEYPHSQGCSVTGGYRYRGPSFPNLQGTYLYADYCTGVIWGATDAGGSWTSTPLLSSFLSISSFGEDEHGELYVADRVANVGGVYRVVDNSPTDLVFGDGFESGDAAAWSAVNP